jgi:hypothetical protein
VARDADFVGVEQAPRPRDGERKLLQWPKPWMVAPTFTDDLRGYPLPAFVTDEQLSVLFELHKNIILPART